MNLTCSKGSGNNGGANNTPATPFLTSVEPTKGIVGDPVTLKGTNLANAAKVAFNGTDSKIIQNDATTLSTVIPNGATIGNNNITITTAGGSSNTMAFEVVKTPENSDPQPPVLSKVIPSANYAQYPVLIYGDNLSGVIDVTFNDKSADVYTNNQNVITTTVPKDLPAGVATVKVRTIKGNATFSFQVLGPPPSPAGVNFSIVAIPPPSYIPSISNDWSCGLFSDFFNGDSHKNDNGASHSADFVDLNSGNDNDGYNTTGHYEYTYDVNKKYNIKNYIEIIYHQQKDTLVGMFSSKFANPCVLTMVLISSKTGTVSTCTFNRRLNDANLQCDE